MYFNLFGMCINSKLFRSLPTVIECRILNLIDLLICLKLLCNVLSMKLNNAWYAGFPPWWFIALNVRIAPGWNIGATCLKWQKSTGGIPVLHSHATIICLQLSRWICLNCDSFVKFVRHYFRVELLPLLPRCLWQWLWVAVDVVCMPLVT